MQIFRNINWTKNPDLAVWCLLCDIGMCPRQRPMSWATAGQRRGSQRANDMCRRRGSRRVSSARDGNDERRSRIPADNIYVDTVIFEGAYSIKYLIEIKRTWLSLLGKWACPTRETLSTAWRNSHCWRRGACSWWVSRDMLTTSRWRDPCCRQGASSRRRELRCKGRHETTTWSLLSAKYAIRFLPVIIIV